jgi:uncharacterized protein (DUF2384 family)
VVNAKILEDLVTLYDRGPGNFEILHLLVSLSGSKAQAQDWLCTPITSLGGAPLALMRSGHSDLVLEFLRRTGIGGFA